MTIPAMTADNKSYSQISTNESSTLKDFNIAQNTAPMLLAIANTQKTLPSISSPTTELPQNSQMQDALLSAASQKPELIALNAKDTKIVTNARKVFEEADRHLNDEDTPITTFKQDVKKIESAIKQLESLPADKDKDKVLYRLRDILPTIKVCAGKLP